MGLASGRTGPVGCLAPHTVTCRKRMEAAIRESDPERWRSMVAEQAWIPGLQRLGCYERSRRGSTDEMVVVLVLSSPPWL